MMGLGDGGSAHRGFGAMSKVSAPERLNAAPQKPAGQVPEHGRVRQVHQRPAPIVRSCDGLAEERAGGGCDDGSEPYMADCATEQVLFGGHLKTLAESRGNAMVKLLRRTTEWHAKRRREPSGARSARPSCRRPTSTGSTSPAEGSTAARPVSGRTWPATSVTSKWTRRSWSNALISASLFLTACTTTPEPKIITKLVQVQVTTPCVTKDVNLDPVFPDTDEKLRAAPGAGDMLQLLAAGRLLRVQTLREWAVALKACQ